jgi:hypothetical protein
MQNSIILTFGSDELYLDNANLQNYITSIQANSTFDRNILVSLGEKTPSFPGKNIEIFRLDKNLVVKKNINNCLQHGEFLNANKFDEIKDSDIIIFTDGDITLQRGLTEEEEFFLRNLKDNDVYVGYNASPTETLIEEASLFDDIYLKPGWEKAFNEDLNKIKCYNTGVLCMNKKTWIKLRDIYLEKFDLVDKIFTHYAKQQWLISYIIGTKGFNIYEMGYDFHNHSCHDLPWGSQKIGNLLKYNNKIVLFKHKWY